MHDQRGSILRAIPCCPSKPDRRTAMHRNNLCPNIPKRLAMLLILRKVITSAEPSRHKAHGLVSSKTFLTLSILPMALSSRSSLLLFARSLLSNSSTLSSSFARALLSSATISFACSNRLALSSSTSWLVAATLVSASCRRLFSRLRACSRSSVSGSGWDRVLVGCCGLCPWGKPSWAKFGLLLFRFRRADSRFVPVASNPPPADILFCSSLGGGGGGPASLSCAARNRCSSSS